MLEIRTLGGFSMGVDGKRIESIGSHKAEAILTYLAVEGRQINRSVLATLLWPESSQEHASTGLRVALSILRKNLGAYLEITREAIRIKPGKRIYLDLTELQTKLGCDHLEEALEIYRGDFLQGFHVRESPDFEDWMRCEQELVHRKVVSALHTAIWEIIDAREYSKGLSFVRRSLELDPLDEVAHQQCMMLLALDNQRSAALAQYEACREILQRELGAGPSYETQELYQQILRGVTPATLGPHTQHNLPAQGTSFVGRKVELAYIRDLIHEPACRLLTLVGPGGCGKTRLAQEAAAKALRSFPDGVYFVPLESINSADYMVPAIAEAIQFDIDSFATQLDPKTQLLDYLRDRSILFVMDGCEHLVPSLGLLSEMLAHAPGLSLLATSRQKLDLKGEWVYALGGLPVPQELQESAMQEVSALRLFSERALQADPQFHLSSENYAYAARICQLVEGMPLGIELAAAWTAVLSPQEIVQEMEKGFDFLASSTQDVPPKHRSLRAAFDSSWLLLTQEQREAFSKLSVFRAGFDRQAAMQVAGVNLAQLSTLLDKSLLRRDKAGRFTMHALVHQFAGEKLKQIPDTWGEINEQHCRYYINLLSSYEADFMGARMLQARDEIRPEMENVRAALNWASLHWDSHAVRKALTSLLCSYIVLGWHAGIIALRDIESLRRETLLRSDSPDPSIDPVILSAQIHQAFLQTNLGQIEESEALSTRCLEALSELGMREELSECLHNLGVNASFRGEYERACDLLEEAIKMGRACEHIVWPTYLLWLGHAYFLLGEYEQGMLGLRKCFDIFERQGNLWGTAFAMGKMGLAADGLGEHTQAMSYHRQALEIFERADNQAGQGYSLSRMSMSAYFLDEYPQAVQFGQEGLRIFEELGHRWGICTSLCRLGFASLGLGEVSKARYYFTDALGKSQHDKMLPVSLYALAGLACTLAQEGDKARANELYQYVQHHPRTPAPYLQKTSRWLGDAVPAVLHGESSQVRTDTETEPVERMIERLSA